MKRKPIYVKTTIQSSMETLWEHTQNPDLHTEWDARFTEITYLPKQEGQPQKFLYKTKIGFGLKISGTGESIGEVKKAEGTRVSSLKFGTEHPLSLIKEGRGYWKYTPSNTNSGIQFETQYDYETKFGKIGEWFDRMLFRPLIGWATAWSFDALRIWLEKGFHPRTLIQKSFIYSILCLLFAFIWIYQGLVPKVMAVHPEEVRMLTELIPTNHGEQAIRIIGFLEIAFGVLWLLPFWKRKLFLFQALLLLLLTISAVVAAPESLVHPFNPISFNSSLLVASLIGYTISDTLPSAKRCVRKRR